MYYYSTSYDTYLAHHGVKGQKWGVRKKKEFHYNPGYSQNQRIKDQKNYGLRGPRAARKISKYMDKGASHNQAVKKYNRRHVATSFAVGLLTTGAMMAGASFVASKYGSHVMGPTGRGLAMTGQFIAHMAKGSAKIAGERLQGIRVEKFDNGVKAKYYDPSKDLGRFFRRKGG